MLLAGASQDSSERLKMAVLITATLKTSQLVLKERTVLAGVNRKYMSVTVMTISRVANTVIVDRTLKTMLNVTVILASRALIATLLLFAQRIHVKMEEYAQLEDR